MAFDIISLMFNPFVLMFISVVTGIFIGKIKFGRFSLGSSGALFTGLFIGWGMYKFANYVINLGPDSDSFCASGYDSAIKLLDNGVINKVFFQTSLIIFVASIGLLAAKDMGLIIRKYGKKFIILGMFITFIGAATTYGATAIIDDTNSYEISGVYTGALTSSPGLGAALETSQSHANSIADEYSKLSVEDKKKVLSMIDSKGELTPENTKKLNSEQIKAYTTNAEAGVGIGYAIGYPFGVIIVIFAVNFFGSIFKLDVDEEKRKYSAEMAKARSESLKEELPVSAFSILSFIIVCLIGYLVGNIKVYMGPLGYFSLGATGGVLIISLLLGYIGKVGNISFRMEPKILKVLRDFGLVFFLAIVGLKYGFKAVDAIIGSGLMLAVVAIFIGIISILSGFILGRYVFKLNWVMLSGALCGGMTSTPGLGACVDALESDDPAAGYGATYPFALFGMILFTILMNKLPLL